MQRLGQFISGPSYDIAVATDNPKCVPLHWLPTADLLFGLDVDGLDRYSLRQFRATIGVKSPTTILRPTAYLQRGLRLPRTLL